MSSAPPAPEYGQPNPAYYQQAPPVTIVAAPIYAPSAVVIVGEYPMQCTCSRCGKQIVTRIEKSVGLLAWLICLGLFFIGFWPCYLIPFCVDACKDTEHYCPSCNALIGVNKKL